jgi:hypothetical protein
MSSLPPSILHRALGGSSSLVMAGLVPAIHVFNVSTHHKTWMPGTSRA